MVVDSLYSLLVDQPVIILDGALATELSSRGAELDDPLWSAKLLLENPGLIQQVHYDYFRAGADVGITSTYQATFEGFAERGLTPQKAKALMRLSIRLAHEARAQFWAESEKSASRRKPLVAASVGPYGAYLHDGSEYRGNYGVSVSDLMDFHRPRMAVLAEAVLEGEADLLACETIPSQVEAEALVRLLEDEFRVPSWLSFSCRDRRHIYEGNSFAACAEWVSRSPYICAVGVNCTAPKNVEELLHGAEEVHGKLLVAYPNSGEQWDGGAKCWLPNDDAPVLAEMAHAWQRAGAKLIGGCCRTTPADIAAIRQALVPTE